jgi:hypothetical protein
MFTEKVWRTLFFIGSLLFVMAKAEAQVGNVAASANHLNQTVQVLELRNYLLKPGKRDSFIRYFEENLIQPQRELKGYPIGQYTVKGSPDNFFWIRAFESMKERSLFLPTFYYGPAWQQRKKIPNGMIANNDNVHLLRPMMLKDDSIIPAPFINSSSLVPETGIAVVDFYISNTKLPQLLTFFARSYAPLLKQCGISNYSLWTCEPEPNDFPRLPVFQDKNLLVVITFYKDESTYLLAMKRLKSKMSESVKADLQDAVTIKNTLILYPTLKTRNQ